MLIVDNPALLPGFCINCKTKYGPKFIQTDILIQDFGTVYICANCFEEIHRALEFDFPNRLRGHEIRIENLEAENERLRVALASLDFLPVRSNPYLSPDALGESSVEGVVEKRAGTKSGPAKSGAKHGSSGVRSSKLSELIGE